MIMIYLCLHFTQVVGDNKYQYIHSFYNMYTQSHVVSSENVIINSMLLKITAFFLSIIDHLTVNAAQRQRMAMDFTSRHGLRLADDDWAKSANSSFLVKIKIIKLHTFWLAQKAMYFDSCINEFERIDITRGWGGGGGGGGFPLKRVSNPFVLHQTTTSY